MATERACVKTLSCDRGPKIAPGDPIFGEQESKSRPKTGKSVQQGLKRFWQNRLAILSSPIHRHLAPPRGKPRLAAVCLGNLIGDTCAHPLEKTGAGTMSRPGSHHAIFELPEQALDVAPASRLGSDRI